LGLSEFTNNNKRWTGRIEAHPAAMNTILDKMHADIKEGTVIKQRGAYAERLWQVVMDKPKASHTPQRFDRSIGTSNEGTASQYRGLGKLANSRPDTTNNA
jgi:hypothetical protein